MYSYSSGCQALRARLSAVSLEPVNLERHQILFISLTSSASAEVARTVCFRMQPHAQKGQASGGVTGDYRLPARSHRRYATFSDSKLQAFTEAVRLSRFPGCRLPP